MIWLILVGSLLLRFEICFIKNSVNVWLSSIHICILGTVKCVCLNIAFNLLLIVFILYHGHFGFPSSSFSGDRLKNNS